MSLSPVVSDIKVFVPAKDFALSKDFYEQLGWKTNWSHSGLAEMELGGVRFFLQDYYNKDWANNFMLYINVESAQAWYEHVSQVLSSDKFGSARVKAPAKQSYGDIVSFVWDPSGVLLHFAEDSNA